MMQKQSSFMDRFLFVSLIAVLFGFLLWKMPATISAMDKQKKWEGEVYEFAQLFTEIYADVQERYVDEIDSQELFEAAIKGMFSALDPHSQWLPPDSLSQLNKETEGQFSGVGLHITLDKNGILTAITPIPGSPAARAGLQPWDRIIEIEGESTEGITLIEAVKKLTGTHGSSVTVKVIREGEKEPLEFTMKRDKIKLESVFFDVIEDGEIGYIRLVRFAESTGADVKKALKSFRKAKVKGVVVDLRYNTGGLLDKAIEISDFFLDPKLLIVSTKGRNPENNKSHYALDDPLCDVPMIVLVNRGSASASEIFAGAMQDHNRGFIIGPEGQTTFGKGSVQTISTLRHSLSRDENGGRSTSGLRLTTARYYTPSGVSIHNKGIVPDFRVPSLTREEERDLLRHGLLGDPDTSKIRDDEEAGASDAASEPEKKPDVSASNDAAANGDENLLSGDIQLKESLKYLRMTLKIQNRLVSSS